MLIKKKHIGNRFVSVMLSLAILAETLFSAGISLMKVHAESSEFTASDTVSQNGIAITTKKTLSYIGNNTYKLVLDATSSIKEAYETSIRTSTEDGVFTVPEGGAGYYLLELWGGTGGYGSDITHITDILNLTIETYPGGHGGQSGYTYGYIYLNEGDSLVYNIGTKGANVVITEGAGGGESGSGSGGGAGEYGLYSVGAGGGFSAIYKFSASDHHTTGATVTESERLSKYIMIAGGGGGGGAANALEYRQTGRADGGRGGIAGISSSGKLTAENNNGVSGTYFVGSNGSSSGSEGLGSTSKTDYVGIGGTDRPGELNKTYADWYETQSGNDWTGTYNSSLDPGAGGNANLRGGGGGAGFTGGSGGIMEAMLLARNVGGGGGGSSFISDEVTYTGLSSIIKNFLNGYNHNDNESGTGGKAIITYLGRDPETLADTNPLQNVTITGKISKYFDIIDAAVDNGVFTGSCSMSHDDDGNITVTGANITPDDDGFAETRNSCSIILTLRAKEGFLGGNKVPIFEDNFTATVPGRGDVTYVANDGADYCNVPLAMSADGNSYSSSKSHPTTFQLSDLYTDYYTDLRNSLSSHWEADMIQDIGTYQVLVQGTSKVLTAPVTPTVTTRYTVQFTVNLKNDPAEVGPGMSKTTTLSALSVITMAAENEILIGADQAQIMVSKGLSYQDGEYHFTVDLNGTRNINDVPYHRTITSTAGNTSDGNDLNQVGGQNHWTVSVSGWYAIAAQGGRGGNGGSARATNLTGSTVVTASGGNGAQGGFVGGLVYFQKGDEITWYVGAAGANGASDTDSDYYNAGKGGAGGVYSWVCRNGHWLICANGGGGGGGGAATYYWGSQYRDNGKSAVRQTAISADFGYSHRGTYGSDGSASSSSASGGKAGLSGRQTESGSSACTNYRVSEVIVSKTVDGHSLSAPTESTVNSTAGYVYISFLYSDNEQIYAEQSSALAGNSYYKDLSLDTAFDRYFDLVGIALTDKTNNSVTKATISGAASGNASGSPSFSYSVSGASNGTGTTVNLSNLSYNNSSGQTRIAKSGNTLTLTANVNLSFDFILKPKDGFLGGNDVPVLLDGMIDIGNSRDQGGIINLGYNGTKEFIANNNATDYANVAISHTFPPEEFTVHDTTITCGESVDLSTLTDTNTIQLPDGSDAWKAEFVTPVLAVGNTVSPTVNTTYDLHQYLNPKAAASKAVVVPSVTGLDNVRYVTVYVQYTVTDDFQNMTYEGPELVDCGNSLSGKIVADSGYLLPDSINVTVGGKNITDFTYNSTTGQLDIPANLIDGNIVLSGEAKIITHTLTFIWEDEKGELHRESYEKGILPGTDLTEIDFYNQHVAISPPAKDHYTFIWSWGTDGNEPITVMPAYDLTVYGRFTPDSYTLTIHYVKEGGGEAAKDYKENIIYGNPYQVISPQVPGYIPDQAVVSGDILEQDTEITVTYTAATGKLYVYYFYADTNQPLSDSPHIENIATGASYNVVSPSVTGYMPDRETVSGIVSADEAANGIVIYVYYEPIKIKVTFDPGEEGQIPLDEATRFVVFNNLYGYSWDETSGSGTFIGLPMPFREGYTFLGWFTSETGDDEVRSDTNVTQATEHTLYAHWQPNEVVSVEIGWGDLTYILGTVKWNPEMHQYTAASFVPSNINSDKITISNNGTVDVIVDYAYTPDDNYEDVTGIFREDGAGSSASDGTTLYAGSSVTMRLGLEGQIGFDSMPQPNSITSGKCTISIGKDGE